MVSRQLKWVIVKWLMLKQLIIYDRTYVYWNGSFTDLLNFFIKTRASVFKRLCPVCTDTVASEHLIQMSFLASICIQVAIFLTTLLDTYVAYSINHTGKKVLWPFQNFGIKGYRTPTSFPFLWTVPKPDAVVRGEMGRGYLTWHVLFDKSKRYSPPRFTYVHRLRFKNEKKGQKPSFTFKSTKSKHDSRKPSETQNT